jgi:hypothetical protein
LARRRATQYDISIARGTSGDHHRDASIFTIGDAVSLKRRNVPQVGVALNASGTDVERRGTWRSVPIAKRPSEADTSAPLADRSVAAQLIAVNFGGLVLGRRLHAVSADNLRR